MWLHRRHLDSPPITWRACGDRERSHRQQAKRSKSAREGADLPPSCGIDPRNRSGSAISTSDGSTRAHTLVRSRLRTHTGVRLKAKQVHEPGGRQPHPRAPFTASPPALLKRVGRHPVGICGNSFGFPTACQGCSGDPINIDQRSLLYRACRALPARDREPGTREIIAHACEDPVTLGDKPCKRSETKT
jgi:hypothetical protein